MSHQNSVTPLPLKNSLDVKMIFMWKNFETYKIIHIKNFFNGIYIRATVKKYNPKLHTITLHCHAVTILI